MNKIVQYIDNVNILIGQYISLCIILMVISVVLEISTRLITGHPLSWTYETSLFLFGGYTVLLAGFANLNGAHVRMDFFYSRMSSKMRAIMDLATFPFFIIFAGTFLWLGLGWAFDAWEYQERSQTQWAPFLLPIKLTVPLGFFFLLISGISKFIKDLSCLINSGKER